MSGNLPNSVTVTRSRRPNAGSRMARLLNEEEEDEFYSSAYGGFAEEENDNDYESESSGHDSIDTDFADTEEDEEEDEAGTGDAAIDDEKRKKRTRRVITKSYREPKTKEASEKKPRNRAAASAASATANGETTGEVTESRRLRASTVRATETAMTQRRKAASEVTAVKRRALIAEIAARKNLPEVRRLTQEELLAEAKITEEINRRSLARYQRMEVERKKLRVQKTVSQQPMIRYRSFAVPAIAEQPAVFDVTVSDDKDVEVRQMLVEKGARCARTLISFADEASFVAAFPSAATTTGKPSSSLTSTKLKRRVRLCPLTGRTARYVDPLTRTPYADLAAFRALRHLYRLHCETGASAVDLLRRFRAGEIKITSQEAMVE